MKYMLLIYGDEALRANWSQDEWQKEMGEYFAYNAMLDSRGIHLSSEALHGVTRATSVRVRDGQTMITDGPFAETKEALGGFYVINAQDLDEAIELAAKIPGVHTGTVEIRPVVEFN